MEDKRVILLRGTDCRPEDEAKFNTWYDQVHIPMLLKFGGVRDATRYQLLSGDGGQYPRYLTMYTFDNRQAFADYEVSPEMAAARADVRETWQDHMFQSLWRAQYETLRTWRK
ncbi:MAG: EthD family reductase [Chloroflexi bacterium]|nr:EthD family reductase [Chloroflexota bacterium]